MVIVFWVAVVVYGLAWFSSAAIARPMRGADKLPFLCLFFLPLVSGAGVGMAQEPLEKSWLRPYAPFLIVGSAVLLHVLFPVFAFIRLRIALARAARLKFLDPRDRSADMDADYWFLMLAPSAVMAVCFIAAVALWSYANGK